MKSMRQIHFFLIYNRNQVTFKSLTKGAGGLVQCVWRLIVLAEDWGSVPRTKMEAQNCLTLIPGNPTHPSGLCVPSFMCTDTHTN